MPNNVTPISFTGPSALAGALSPDSYSKQQQLMFQQQLAQNIMGQGMEPINPNRVAPGGVAYKINPLEGASKVGQALIGALMQKNAIQQQGDLTKQQMQNMGGLFGAGPQGQPPQAQPQTDPSGVPGFNAIPQQGPQPSQGMPAQAAPQGMPAQQGGVLQMPGMSPQQSQMMYMADPNAYIQGLLKFYEPTEIAKMLRESGAGPAQAQSAYAAKLNPLIPLREGAGGVQFGDDGKPHFSIFSPKLGQGQQLDNQGNVQVAPGYMAAQQQTGTMENQLAADRAKGIQGAEAPFRPITIEGPGGRHQTKFLPQVQGYPGGNPIAPAGQAPAPVPQAPAPGGPAPIAPPDPSAVQVKPMGMAPIGNGKPLASTSPAQSKMGPDPWSTVPKFTETPGAQSTFERGSAENAAKQGGELQTKYGQLASDANQRKAFNDQALSLVDQADTGPLAARQADVKNVLIKLVPGLTEDSFKNTPSATILLQKDLVNAATQKAKQQFGARMTQSEVMLMLQKASPNVDMPKAAIKYLLNSDNAQLGYQMQQANDLGRYLKQGGDPTQFESWYAKNFPLSKSVGNVHLKGTVGEPAKQTLNWSDLK